MPFYSDNSEGKKRKATFGVEYFFESWFCLSTEISFGDLFKIRMYSLVLFISFLNNHLKMLLPGGYGSAFVILMQFICTK